MPIPLLGWAGIATATAIFSYFFMNDEKPTTEEKQDYYEPTIILGPQASGKTHLANWLARQELLNEYKATNNSIKIGEFLDTRGGEIQVKTWEDLIKDQKNIFYLFDMESFLVKKEYAKSKYNEIVIRHISFFTEYLEKKGSMSAKKLIIIGTHLDKIDNSKAQDIIGTLQKEIDLVDTKIIYGSLLDKEKAQKLEEEIKMILQEGTK